MSPNRWALLYRTDIGASGGRFSKNSLCLKAAVWIQPRPHCSPARALWGRQRARRRAPLEGVRAPKRRSTSSLLRRRSWPLLFLDRVWPPRSSALCFLVQKEVEREKKKPKNFFFRDDKVFDPIGFPQITSLFSQFFFCSQIFFDSQIFFHFINHCFPRQIVVGWIKNKPKNFFRGAKFLTFLFIHRFFSSFTSQIFFVSLHIYRGVWLNNMTLYQIYLSANCMDILFVISSCVDYTKSYLLLWFDKFFFSCCYLILTYSSTAGISKIIVWSLKRAAASTVHSRSLSE